MGEVAHALPGWNDRGTAYTEERMSASGTVSETEKHQPEKAIFTVLVAISFCHLLNDLVQSLIPALYPILKESFRLDFGQLGLISLTYQLTASLLQPLVGFYTDRRPMPYSLPIGMSFTLVGLILLSIAHTYPPTVLCPRPGNCYRAGG